MSISIEWLYQRAFKISYAEATFSRRGFLDSVPSRRDYLEQIGTCFLMGYHAALEENDMDALSQRLNAFGANFRGFAYEGAAMGLTLLALLFPWEKRRWQAFLAGPAAAHVYMTHVGAGWAYARLRRRVERRLPRLHSLLGWLVIDGYGFHEGYFYWRRYIERHVTPAHLTGYAQRVFDQGLGRSLWFITGANIARIQAMIASFTPTRHTDLWSGIGLACAYAGGIDRREIEGLRNVAGAYLPEVAQGAAFAAQARQRAGNPSLHTERACEILCGMSAEAAACLTEAALDGLRYDGSEPAYEIWRQRIQASWRKEAL